MTTKSDRTNPKKGPAAEYHVQKKNGSFWVMTPDGKAIVVPHKTRHEAQMIANVFNHTKRDPLTVVTERKNKEKPLVIFVEGGLVQDVIRLNPRAKRGYENAEYDLVDYDVLESSSNQEVKEYFENRSPEVIAYMKKHLPFEYGRFQERIREAEKEESR